MIWIRGLEKAFKKLVKHPKEWSLICVLDLIFVILFMSALVWAWMPVVDEFQSIAGDMNNVEQFVKESDKFVEKADIIGAYVLRFFMVAFVIWLLFQGSTWYFAHKIQNIKEDFGSFMKKFFIVTIMSLACIFVIFWLTSVLASLSVAGLPFFGMETVSLINILLTLILYVFTLITYANLKHDNYCKNTLEKFKKSWKDIVPAVLLVLFVLYLMNMIALLMWAVIFLFLAVFILICLPAIAFLKVYLIEMMKN